MFRYLLEEAVSGSLAVYFAAIPTDRVMRFEPSFRPELAASEMVVQAIMNDWRKGQFAPVWVYPIRDVFIASDDYFTLAAAERGKPDYLPCWILGRPNDEFAKDIQGPIAAGDLRKLLGVEQGG